MEPGTVFIRLGGKQEDIQEFLSCISVAFGDGCQVIEMANVSSLLGDGTRYQFAKWKNPNG